MMHAATIRDARKIINPVPCRSNLQSQWLTTGHQGTTHTFTRVKGSRKWQREREIESSKGTIENSWKI